MQQGKNSHGDKMKNFETKRQKKYKYNFFIARLLMASSSLNHIE